MSRTDKTVPYRVREYRDGSIDHDHTTGRCVEESREQALEAHHSSWKRYDHDCPRRTRYEYECPGYCPAEDGPGAGWCWAARERHKTLMKTNEPWDSIVQPAWHVERWRRRRVFCVRPHTVTRYNRGTPCADCDARPTCEYDLDWSYRRIVGSAPHDYRQLFHRANRRNERDSLHSARRDWNANGDTDIEVVDRYHRHCANWYWF